MEGDGVNHPESVPCLDNFHTTAVTRAESLVTTCENMPRTFRGNTIQVRIRWARPNRELAP
jgi:hypothetical protein